MDAAIVAAASVTAIATAVLAFITWRYVKITGALVEAAAHSSQAAERSASVAEQSLRLQSTPVVGWAYLRAFINDDGNLEVEYRLQNTGAATALNVDVALERYPVDGPSDVTPFRRTGVSLDAGQTKPSVDQQHLSHVIPQNPEALQQWNRAVNNESYGLVSIYHDVLGRRWRCAKRQRTYELRIELVD